MCGGFCVGASVEVKLRQFSKGRERAKSPPKEMWISAYLPLTRRISLSRDGFLTRWIVDPAR